MTKRGRRALNGPFPRIEIGPVIGSYGVFRVRPQTFYGRTGQASNQYHPYRITLAISPDDETLLTSVHRPIGDVLTLMEELYRWLRYERGALGVYGRHLELMRLPETLAELQERLNADPDRATQFAEAPRTATDILAGQERHFAENKERVRLVEQALDDLRATLPEDDVRRLDERLQLDP